MMKAISVEVSQSLPVRGSEKKKTEKKTVSRQPMNSYKWVRCLMNKNVPEFFRGHTWGGFNFDTEDSIRFL